MTSIIDNVKNTLKKSDYSNSQFYRDYQKTAEMYQDLLDKGLTSKRQSKLLSNSDKTAANSMHFNRTED